MDPRRKAPSRKSAIRSAASNAVERLESRQLLSAADVIVYPALNIIPAASGPAVAGFTPTQIRHAYGFDKVSFNGVSGDGTGQTIAIVDAFNDPNIVKGLATFDAKFSLPAPPSFTRLNQKGGGVAGIAADSGWASEISLDVEWAHAIAPKANIVLVESNSDSLSDLLAAVDTARRQPGVSVISMSWGGGEFLGQKSDDAYFTTPKGHTPETFVAASGDEGSFGGAEWPASSPNVLSVGGTSLYTLDNAGTYANEAPWNDSSGGMSRFEARPAFQAKAKSSANREAPDVSYNADPYTGFAVYDSIADQGYVGWQEIGGTSAGTPQWAALVAIADQGRALLHKAALDGSANTLPALYGVYSTSTYLTTFNDITSTWRSFFSRAHAGYDEVTGLGTPDAARVISLLVSIGAPTPAVQPASQGAGGLISSGAAHPSVQHQTEPPENPGEPSVLPLVVPPIATPSVQQTSSGTASAERTNPAASSASSTSAVALAASSGAASIIGQPAAPHGSTLSGTGAIDLPSFTVRAASLMGSHFAISTAAAASVVAREMSMYLASMDQWIAPFAGAVFSRDVPADDATPSLPKSVEGPAVPIVGALAQGESAARAFFHLAPIDAQSLFSDALSAFARQSAEIAFPAAAPDETLDNRRAWAITAGVLAIDAMLLAGWYSKRRRITKPAAMYKGIFHDGEPVRRGV